MFGFSLKSFGNAIYQPSSANAYNFETLMTQIEGRYKYLELK